MRVAFGLLAIAILAVACDDTRVYEKNKDFDGRVWLVNDTAQFNFKIAGEGRQYNILLNLRNALDYKWNNIYVNFVLADSAGQVLSSKLVTNQLFQPKYPFKPLGRSGLGDIYDHRFPLLSAYSLKPGKYTVTLQQLMRTDSLKGVLAAGIRVEQADQ